MPSARAQVLGRASSWGDVSDEELVLRALERDRWAEEVLFRRHAPDIARTVGRLLGNTGDVDDVVQDTFLAALDELHSLRDPRALRSWLLQIAVRKVHRRFRRRRILRVLGLDRGADDRCLEALAAPGLDSDRRAQLVLLDQRLQRLSLRLRTAWMLRYVDGRSLPEVAVACGCSLATAKRLLSHARAELGVDLASGGADE